MQVLISVIIECKSGGLTNSEPTRISFFPFPPTFCLFFPFPPHVLPHFPFLHVCSQKRAYLAFSSIQESQVKSSLVVVVPLPPLFDPMADENRWIVVDVRPYGNTSGSVHVVKDGSTLGFMKWVVAPPDILQRLIQRDIVSINDGRISSIVSEQNDAVKPTR